MKKTVMILAVVFLFSIGVFAQAKPDYSGEWSLDVSKSKLPENARIESMTVKAAQSATEIKVERDTKRTPNPNGAGGGGGGQGGGRPGGMGGPQATTFTLDGVEKSVSTDTPNGSMTTKLKASFGSDGSLNLNTVRQFGQGEATTTEVWTLSDGGKTLTIKNTQVSQRGTSNSEYVLTKK